MPLPTLQEILQPFAADAAVPANRRDIPNDNPGTPGTASMELGFPPDTMIPKTSGGTPPFGQDVNGVLYLLSSHVMAVQAGRPYLFSADLAAAIGGYPKGITLGMADQTGIWINQADGNSTDPDDSSAANWEPLFKYGPTTLAGLAGGVYTLSPIEAAAGLLILSGVLGSNQQIVVPKRYREWLVVNATSGAFTVTVKTSDGAGVAIPQGGLAAPTGIYCDTISVYPTVAPITIPTSVAATPNTIPLRDNNGDIFARYLNTNQSNENPTITSIGVWGADGYLRRMSMLNLELQMQLANINGQLANGQVPYAVIAQWAATLFTSPAFTGVPTAPTAAPGTSTTQLATTAFVNQASSLLANGYIRFPNGFTLQWGFKTRVGSAPETVSFATAFTSFCAGVVFGMRDSAASGQVATLNASPNVNNFSVNQADGTVGTYWLAFGV